MMSTSSHSKAENGVIQSSIGLLQERFRQLQRMKEMRENKELLRMFSDYNNNNRSTNTNTNNTMTSTNSVSPIIVSNTSYTTSTITSTTTTINNNMNSTDNNKNISDSSMQYNDDSNDQLQIFIPPNYSSLNNPKSSCYSSSSATTTSTQPQSPPPPPPSSSSSSRNSNMTINPSDISLTLWSYSNSTPATTYPFQRENLDNQLSTMNMQRPVAGVGVSRASTTCVSTFYNKMEDPHHHVTDVDTTLHL